MVMHSLLSSPKSGLVGLHKFGIAPSVIEIMVLNLVNVKIFH